jgi:hypothetical protein
MESFEIFDSNFIDQSEGLLFCLSYIVASCRKMQALEAAKQAAG